MRYIISQKRLETDDGTFIKQLHCPLQKQWDALLPYSDNPLDSLDDVPDSDPRRYCASCRKCVLNLNHFSEQQIIAICKTQPQACVYLREDHPELEMVEGTEEASDSRRSMFFEDYEALTPGEKLPAHCNDDTHTQGGLLIIHTARSVAAIEAGIQRGFWPFLVVPDKKSSVRQKLIVEYLHETKTLDVSTDFRHSKPRWLDREPTFLRAIREQLPSGEKQLSSEAPEDNKAILWFDEDAHASPIAAYLIPPDLAFGTQVFLADVIEAIPSRHWNQGDSWRLKSATAIWTKYGFDIQKLDPIMMIG